MKKLFIALVAVLCLGSCQKTNAQVTPGATEMTVSGAALSGAGAVSKSLVFPSLNLGLNAGYRIKYFLEPTVSLNYVNLNVICHFTDTI